VAAAAINGSLGAALKREMRKETDFGLVSRMDWPGLPTVPRGKKVYTCHRANANKKF